jgi:YHS domain-containing protein
MQLDISFLLKHIPIQGKPSEFAILDESPFLMRATNGHHRYFCAPRVKETFNGMDLQYTHQKINWKCFRLLPNKENI